MKTIRVPKTKEAMDLLDIEQCPSELLHTVELPEDVFKSIWQTNLLFDLSRNLDVWIDDYESGSVIGREAIKAGRAICQNHVRANPELPVLRQIRELFDLADRYDTCVCFDL